MGFWHIYCGIYGGGESVVAGEDIITTRLTLLGTSNLRLNINGTSAQRLTLIGTSR